MKVSKTALCIQIEQKALIKSVFGWRHPCVEVYFLFLLGFFRCYPILEKKKKKRKRELRGDISLGRGVDVSEFL